MATRPIRDNIQCAYRRRGDLTENPNGTCVKDTLITQGDIETKPYILFSVFSLIHSRIGVRVFTARTCGIEKK